MHVLFNMPQRAMQSWHDRGLCGTGTSPNWDDIREVDSPCPEMSLCGAETPGNAQGFLPINRYQNLSKRFQKPVLLFHVDKTLARPKTPQFVLSLLHIQPPSENLET